MMIPRDDAETWVIGPDGSRYWGAYGAAGALIVTPESRILLQLRAAWTHQGGTWGVPGGARKAGESAIDGALREFHEEVAHAAVELLPQSTWVMDRGNWTYTTVVFSAPSEFPVEAADAESEAFAWVESDQVQFLPLHPGFAHSWPTIRQHLGTRPTFIVTDADDVASVGRDGLPGSRFDLPGDRWFPRIEVTPAEKERP